MNLELEKLKDIENKIQKDLKTGEYTFIGPVDQSLLISFVTNANIFAPRTNFFGRNIHQVLSNKEVILKTLQTVESDLGLRIYVVNGLQRDILSHDSVEGFCKKNNIEFI